jgi:hypothetical protein
VGAIPLLLGVDC